jgi:hypothetical protein
MKIIPAARLAIVALALSVTGTAITATAPNASGTHSQYQHIDTSTHPDNPIRCSSC